MACVFFVIIGFIWLKHMIESVMNPEVIWPTMRLHGNKHADSDPETVCWHGCKDGSPSYLR